MMLLTETIKNCTSAISSRRTAQEKKNSAEDYSRALARLSEASGVLEDAFNCAAELRSKGIIKQPWMTQQTRDELMECINDCGKGVFEGALTVDLANVLKTKSVAIADKIDTTWKNAASEYAEGIKGYLSMIGGISSDPQHAKDLLDSIDKTVNGALSILAVNKLLSDVAEAQKIVETFSLNSEVEVFLKKVSSHQATVVDLTPNVLTWLEENGLIDRLKIRF